MRCAFGVDLPPVFLKIRSRHKLQTRGTEVTCGAVERAPFSQLCSRPEPDSALATFSLSCDDSCRQTLRLVLSCAACFPYRNPQSIAVFDAFVWATQIADQDQVFSGSPDVEGAVSRAFAVIVSRLVPSGNEQAGFPVDQTGAALDIV